jgi:hypothetical protein
MKKIALALSASAALSLTGCSILNQEVAPRVAKAVAVYCLETPEARTLIRAQVNAMTAPNTVRVTCEGDQP